MKILKKLALFLCVAIFSLLACTCVFADYYEFSINGPDSCGIDEEIEISITLASDQMLQDSDAVFSFDTEYFELIDSSSDDYDAYNGTVRLRGDFSEDNYSCTWTVTLRALEEGEVEFDITDRWVQTGAGNSVSSTVSDYTITVGEGSSDVSETGGVDSPEVTVVSSVSYEDEFEFYFVDPASVPSCFEETTASILGMDCKVWKLNEKMAQDATYSADLADYYAVYGYIDSESDACWYLYDTTEDSFQRMVLLQDVEIENTVSEQGTTTSEDSFNLFDNILLIIVIIFVVLVILIVIVNVLFGKLEAKSRRKRVLERQRLSREELEQKRAIEKKIQEKKIAETESQNMRRPE